MPIHLTFNNIRHSDAVSSHVNEAFEELIKITDNKFPFHVNLNKIAPESYHVGINCSYKNKNLFSKADHENLYKALSKGIDSMKIQVIRKSEKVRN
jgi:Ribosome-associated protein Y (PSrp-1)